MNTFDDEKKPPSEPANAISVPPAFEMWTACQSACTYGSVIAADGSQ